MLREIVNVYQPDARVRRRWFCDDYFDIFIWEESGGRILELQFCYDKAAHERMLRWHDATGFTHHGVDGGEASTFKNRTPILVADGVLPLPTVLGKFDAHALDLELRIRGFIRQRLLEYGRALDNPKGRG
jgi:hypothetical protein